MKKTTKKRGANKEACSTQACTHSACQNGAIYGLGVIGAAIYFIQTATGFWTGVFGIIKAILWPAFLLHDAFKFLGM